MKKKIKVSTLLLGVVSLILCSCSKEKEEVKKQEEAVIIEKPIEVEKECDFVDDNWPASATLSKTLSDGAGTVADAILMNDQNTAIKTFWRGISEAAPVFRFVKNGTDWKSTYNAVSYDTGKIYYGEGIFRDAKSKDASNLVNIMILAHEYGHQLQYTFRLPSVKESTARASDLEADGMAGYYLRKGYGKTTYYQIAAAYEFAYSIGDNQITKSDHHGKPAQRRSAVRLGFLLADPANTKLTATQFDTEFFYYYNGVLNASYRMAKPEGMSDKGHRLIMSKMQELQKIQSGKMSDAEYFNL
ncbi:neutral zinc metallopeptidase [Flavobacterium columnare]|uniref:Metalloprotease n=1 Tax=Flavobacterium columnare TaxID=996 RepID=A0AAI8GAJ6_9FLAO|nr:metalloprotease [Flavobacterium columnare]AMO19956.1 metalloprotease [Flavobacterium columnare]QOG56966.1 metalloprotease [Flavobacterium columnare]QOG59690.1 metalloprotease [Flavobacterium columnare]QOG62410.1 metalloprotease [Flavobacterium columnare]QOG65134.1 metalloprotease [Flavobacterium columnare]